MSRRSDYFSTMLGSSFQEGSSAPGDMLEIQVTDVEPEVLYAALQWVYTDRVDADMPAQQLLQVRPPFIHSSATMLHSIDMDFESGSTSARTGVMAAVVPHG